MSTEQFLQVADLFPDPALLLTSDGVIVAANRGAAALGLLSKDVAGRALSDLTATPAAAVRDYLRLCSRSREPVVGSLTLLAGAEAEVPCRCHGSILHHGTQGVETRLLLRLTRKDAAPSQFAVLNQQIDELTKEVHRRRQIEEALQESVEQHRVMEEHLTALVQASATLTGTLEPSAVLTSILQLSARLLPADAYAVWRFHPPSGRWHVASSSGLSEEYKQAAVRALEQTPQMPETPVIADDVFSLPMLAERQEAYRAEGLRSLLAVPLRIHGQVCGTLVIYHRQPHRFDDIEVRVATAVANLSAAAIGSADLYEGQGRLRAEAQEHKERLRVTLESIGDAVIATDTAGCVTFLNPVAESLTGWTMAVAQGSKLEDVFHIVNEHSRQVVENPAHRVLREGVVVGLANHTVLISRDGREIPIDDSGAPIRTHEGQIAGVVLIFRDVTERKQAEAALRQSEERFARFMQHLPGLAWIKDEQGRYVYANEAAMKIFRRQREELYGRTDEEVFPPETAAQSKANDRQVSASATGIQAVETLQHEDGVLHYSIVSKFAIPGQDGKAALVGGMAIDITERRVAEQTLRESEERLRLALEAGRMGVWDWNVRTNEIQWSDNLEPIHGLAPGTFGGTLDAFKQLIHRDDQELVSRAMTRALEERTGYDVEFRNVWPDGSVHWMTGKGKVFTDHAEPSRMIGVGMDITERKRAEQDAQFLADASDALAGLVDYESTLQKVARLAVPSFADWCTVDMMDENGSLRRLAVAHVDPSKVELAHELHRRYPADPNAPQGVWNILRTGYSEIISEISDDLLRTSVQDADLLNIMRELGLKSYMGVPLTVRGKVLGVITLIAAESGRRYYDADLIMAEDLAHRAAVAIENARLYQAVREADRRKDEFLALLGHELRNPLAPIRNALHVLKLPGADPAITKRAHEMMERQIEYMVRLVDDLLDVSRIMRGKVDLRREPVELATVVARAVETSQPVIDAEGHQLTVSVPPEPLWVNGDLVRLAQVASNLLNNAAKYTERTGQIWIAAAREEDEAVLRVRDTGIGIAGELLPRLFDMFFQAERRTKDSQGGLGIGLSLVRGLVELHGGSVEAHSAGLGTGSEFVIRLPLLARDESATDRREQAGSTEGKFAPRRVLVVDDNVDAADSLAILLRLGGQDVQVAYDGLTALEKAKADPPAIAFLDLGMPKMDGYELARAFRSHARLKGVVLVALTGWGQPEDRQRTREVGFDHHLVKPVEVDALHRLLSER